MTWWKSYVIEVSYNDEIVSGKTSYQRKLFLQNFIAIISRVTSKEQVVEIADRMLAIFKPVFKFGSEKI